MRLDSAPRAPVPSRGSPADRGTPSFSTTNVVSCQFGASQDGRQFTPRHGSHTNTTRMPASDQQAPRRDGVANPPDTADAGETARHERPRQRHGERQAQEPDEGEQPAKRRMQPARVRPSELRHQPRIDLAAVAVPVRLGVGDQEPHRHEEGRANPDAGRLADAAPRQFARARLGLPRQQADRLDPAEEPGPPRPRSAPTRRAWRRSTRESPAAASTGRRAPRGRRPASRQSREGVRSFDRPSRPRCGADGHASAGRSTPWRPARTSPRCCAGIARNTPGVVTFSR